MAVKVKANIITPQRLGVDLGGTHEYPVGGSLVSYTPVRTTGEVIGKITIDGVERSIYGISETATTAKKGLMSAADKTALNKAGTDIGDTSALTTTAKTLVGAANELNSKIVGTDIGVSNAVFRTTGEIVVNTAFNAFEYVDIYLSVQAVALPCIRIFPNKSDIYHAIVFAYSNITDNGLRMFAGTFHTAGRYIDSFKLSMSNTAGGAGTIGAWVDVSNSDLLYVRKIIGYNR